MSTVAEDVTTGGSERFIIAFAAAQYHVRSAMKGDWLTAYHAKYADLTLQDAFELLSADLQKAILEVHAKLGVEVPEPPKRTVGADD